MHDRVQYPGGRRVELTAFDELMGGMSELTATARAAARPAAELRALDDATRDFDAVLGEARALSADPRAAHVLRSEEHTSELQSLMRSSYAVFCLNKQKRQHTA